MFMKASLIFCTAFFVLFSLSSAAFSFDQNAVKNIKQQVDPDQKAVGGRFRSLIIKPQLSITEEYDNNIFREANNSKKDLITKFKPELNVQTDWSLHQIGFRAMGDLGRHRDFDKENYEDQVYMLFGRYDLDYETYLSLNLSSQFRHEDRGALDDVGGDQPIEFRVDTADLRFSRELGILKLYMTGIARNIAYKDSVRSGTVIDNSIRDRRQYTGEVKLAYGVSDNADLFILGRYDRRLYDQLSSSYRDSKGGEVRSGVSVNLSGKLQADAYLGYLYQDYTGGFSDISGVNWGGNLLWNMNGLTSLEMNVERMVVETTLAGSSGVLRTKASAELQHAVMSNLLATARSTFYDDRYKGGSSTRDNQTVTLGAVVEYDMNRNWGVLLDYDYLYRNFVDGDGDYDNHKVGVSVKYAY